MKKIGAFLACLLLPLLASAFCEKCEPDDKLYVNLDDLTFDETGIWFKRPVDSLIVGTQAIYVDSLGYYISKNQEAWKCPKCGRVNRGHRGWGCAKCGWPYDD